MGGDMAALAIALIIWYGWICFAMLKEYEWDV